MELWSFKTYCRRVFEWLNKLKRQNINKKNLNVWRILKIRKQIKNEEPIREIQYKNRTFQARIHRWWKLRSRWFRRAWWRWVNFSFQPRRIIMIIYLISFFRLAVKCNSRSFKIIQKLRSILWSSSFEYWKIIWIIWWSIFKSLNCIIRINKKSFAE